MFGGLDTTHALINTAQFCWGYESHFSLRKSVLFFWNTVSTRLMDRFMLLTKSTLKGQSPPLNSPREGRGDEIGKERIERDGGE